jgi:putative nucleotidyltransferase with HDIG domain
MLFSLAWPLPQTRPTLMTDAAKEITETFLQALWTKSVATAQHSERVAGYAAALARAVGLSEQRAARLERAGLLHDVGKLNLADAILEKPGPLSEEEWVHMQWHPDMGADMLRPHQALRELLPAVIHHHERYDGAGYPAGLRGRDIPLDARVMAIADCYDAMTSERPYKRALSTEEAADQLQAGAGTHFDPMLVAVFISQVIPALEGGVLLAS